MAGAVKGRAAELTMHIAIGARGDSGKWVSREQREGDDGAEVALTAAGYTPLSFTGL